MHLKGRGRRWSWPTSRYYPGISMERLMKAMKNLSHDSQSRSRGLNPDSIIRRRKAVHSTATVGTTILNLGLDGKEWSPSRSGRFPLRERTPCSHRTGDCVSEHSEEKIRSSGKNHSPTFSVRITL
jgi:hypothetical protein